MVKYLFIQSSKTKLYLNITFIKNLKKKNIKYSSNDNIL